MLELDREQPLRQQRWGLEEVCCYSRRHQQRYCSVIKLTHLECPTVASQMRGGKTWWWSGSAAWTEISTPRSAGGGEEEALPSAWRRPSTSTTPSSATKEPPCATGTSTTSRKRQTPPETPAPPSPHPWGDGATGGALLLAADFG